MWREKGKINYLGSSAQKVNIDERQTKERQAQTIERQKELM